MAAFNMNVNTQKENVSDIFLENVEALASESGGSFPACQKNKGNGEYASIPFCVNVACQNNTWKKKGTLEVNYGSQ